MVEGPLAGAAVGDWVVVEVVMEAQPVPAVVAVRRAVAPVAVAVEEAEERVVAEREAESKGEKVGVAAEERAVGEPAGVVGSEDSVETVGVVAAQDRENKVAASVVQPVVGKVVVVRAPDSEGWGAE